MPATVVVGTQWGDEGKGKLTDLLARDMDMVVRYQGGHNAGHRIVVDGEAFALQLVPSGVLYPHITPVIGNGVVVDPAVLLDEVEKAHPDVFNVLLQVLDDGRLTDGQGRTVDFTNVVLIMTSNLVGDPLSVFRPEFVNRIDDIIRFRSLSEDDLAVIVGIQLGRLRQRLGERHLVLEVTPAASALLAHEGFDPAFGARPLKRVIQRRLEDPIALSILRGRYHDGDVITVDVVDGDLAFG